MEGPANLALENVPYAIEKLTKIFGSLKKKPTTPPTTENLALDRSDVVSKLINESMYKFLKNLRENSSPEDMETEMERLLSDKINNNKDKIWTTKEELTDVIKTVENMKKGLVLIKELNETKKNKLKNLLKNELGNSIQSKNQEFIFPKIKLLEAYMKILNKDLEGFDHEEIGDQKEEYTEAGGSRRKRTKKHQKKHVNKSKKHHKKHAKKSKKHHKKHKKN